jgi:hypothetical protein
VPYDGFNNSFAAYRANRIPAAAGDATDPTNRENDTMLLAYRISLVPEPGITSAAVAFGALWTLRSTRRPARAR